MIKDLIITPLQVIDVPGGNVSHAIKKSSNGFVGFGEAYFSQINSGSIKAWKRHRLMTLNLIVVFGVIRFVIFDDRNSSKIQFQEIVISSENYSRLTIPPMLWVGFQGLSSGNSMLLNFANIEHDPSEIDKRKIEQIEYDWSN